MKNPSMFGSNEMKRSPSELALRELFHSEDDDKIRSDERQQKYHIFADNNNPLFALQHPTNLDITKNLSSCSSFEGNPYWSENLDLKHSNIATPIDCQSSIRKPNLPPYSGDSPTSATKPKGADYQTNGASSGSSREQSDEDDPEIEAGPCEQSTDPIDVKRIKRKVSNRESARRSRKRKQAHLADLEQQVEQLRGENESLFKQLANAAQHFRDASTNNRVLKSDVEALRAKVKLAEDMVTRGSLTSSLSHLLQNYLNTPQTFVNNNVPRVDNVSPTISTITMPGDNNNAPYLGVADSAIALENGESFNGSINNGVVGDTVSCVSEIWPWESHVGAVAK